MGLIIIRYNKMENIKTGLVLSGGGTKGIAHAGVLKFLLEQNIEINMISGTSAGALAGALFAFGKTPEEILKFFQSVNFFHWRHFVFNKPGIVSSQIFRIYLDPIFADLKIKDAKIPLLLAATDLCSGTLEVFDEETKVVDAIISSAAIPGVATPFRLNGKVYCDGGVIDNFPVDLVLDKADKIIGVYLSPLNKVTPERVSSIRSVTQRALDILIDRGERYKFKYCDWLISLNELEHYGSFETKLHRMEDIFNIGYEVAKKTFSPDFYTKKSSSSDEENK